MKRTCLLLILLVACLAGHAQQLNVKSVNLRPNDARARTNPRDDAKGNKCAIIRVGIVGVNDLKFPDAVGEVEHSMNEYVVYVPDGLKKFRYEDKSGHYKGTIVFDEWELEVNSLASYDVVFETDSHLRAAIFTNLPKEAQLTFDGQRVDVNEEGLAWVEKPVGEYFYKVDADGYTSTSGKVVLTEDEISTTTVVALEQRKHYVRIIVSPLNATVFVDNIPYTSTNLEIELTEGKHTIRATAPYHEEKEMTFTVNADGSERVEISLKEAKQEIVKHKEERSRTNISVRGANYFTFGFGMLGVHGLKDLSNENNAFDFNMEYTHVSHFAGIMGIRFGLGGGFIKSNKNEKYVELAYDKEIDSLLWLAHVDIPLQIGFSFPFGRYNQHMLNVYGGGYGKYVFSVSGLKETYIDPSDDLVKDLNKEEKEKGKVDYGLRLSAMLDIGHFTIGAYLNQSLHDMGFSLGANIGWKFYKKKKD